jgi:ABC-type transport system involved in multi-copper enzyme maturation permease subunit
MSPLVRKELRSLLPPWGLALLVAVLPIWFVWPGEAGIWAGPPGYLVYAPFALGVLLLSLTPFGQELNWGTFSILLAQPVSRARIWRIKTLLLALALLLVFVAFLLSALLRIESVMNTSQIRMGPSSYSPEVSRQMQTMIAENRREALLSSLMVGGVGVLGGFAGGLWTTLLFRQVSAAFWLTLLVPMGLGMLVSQLLGGLPDALAQPGVCAVLGLYSAVGFVWARRLFEQVQDTQWTGGVVSLPKWGRATAQARPGIGGRKRQAVRMLLSKELKSQYVNLLLAGGLLLIHLVVLAARWLGADYLATHRSLGMTLEAFPALWLAMPLLVGSVAVAEERKLGTFETLSCLPTSRWVQFSIKLGLALLLGIFLGAVVPLTLERLGTAAGLHTYTSVAPGQDVLALVSTMLLAASGIALLSFYGSSLARNTLQALGASILACVIASVLTMVAAHPPTLDEILLCGPRLIAWILVPVMLLAVIGLAYRNYRQLQLSAKAWRHNGLVLLVALLGATTVTSAVYHRFWEAWLPLEPSHPYRAVYESGHPVGGGSGLAFSGRQVTTPKVQATATKMAALLFDGRLWLRQRAVRWMKIARGQAGYSVFQAKGRAHAGFVPGSNWQDFAVSDLGCFAIRADGTLWDLSGVQPGSGDADSSLIRVGDSRSWVKLSADWDHYCGLKSDGSLWEWRYRGGPAGASGEKFGAPAQVGTDTNWIAVASSAGRNVAIKTDGTIWRWGELSVWSRGSGAKHETLAYPQKWLAFPGRQRPVSISYDGYGLAAVCDDGSLWLGGGSLPSRLLWHEANAEMVRYGEESDWKQVELVENVTGVGIKRDGSMWTWEFARPDWRRSFWRPPLVPLSEYTLWVGVCSYGRASLALGRDGTLCLWGDPEGDAYFDRTGRYSTRLLLPSRIHAVEVADLPPR